MSAAFLMLGRAIHAMTRRCDRCRAEYESGADFGGHDYCMTCYVKLKHEEEHKRASAEKLLQQKTDYRRQQIRQQYIEGASRRQVEEDTSRRDLEVKKRLPSQDEAEMRKRMKWRMDLTKRRSQDSETQRIFVPIDKTKMLISVPASQKKDERATYAARLMPHAPKKEEGKKAKKPNLPEKSSITLSVAAGLPVSLSIGQRQVSVVLLGKNSSAAQVAVSLAASVLDSQKSTVSFQAEPRNCTIEPEGEAKFKLGFDLPQDVARGRLALSACLKENAVYLDRQSAKSNSVELSSQVKTPPDLQYVRGSAHLAGDALILVFNNVGESGGILEPNSSLKYFLGGAAGKKASIAQRTKMKGGEKGIALSFSPVGAERISRLEIDLAGKDSNGKPYSLKRKISGKEKPDDGGEKGERKNQAEK
jgi:hypothetical protein